VRVGVAAAVAAVAFDAGVRSGVASLGGAFCIAVVAAGMAWTGRVRNRQAMAALALAPVFGSFLAVRMSPWLLLPDIAAAALLLLVGASFSRSGSVLDLGIQGLVMPAWDVIRHALTAPAFLASSLPRADRRWAAVVRGLLVAAPVILVLGLLLASADEVFASLFDVSLDGSVVLHVVLWAMGAWGMSALLGLASSPATVAPGVKASRLGQVETCMVLGSLVALYAAFVLAQVVGATAGGRHVLETAGLTYAEYARRGFFELLVVASITLALLLALDNGTRLVRRLSLGAVALTLVIVAVAVRRLHLYEQAFGLTMLRLCSTVFALWVGAVFVLLAARLAGVGRGRQWFTSAAVGVGLAVLLALNLLNPEAVVVQRNAERPDFDPVHALTLTPDAVPALVEAGLGGDACAWAEKFDQWDGWLAWNLSRERATGACGSVRAGQP
jgi:hypothetical protein